MQPKCNISSRARVQRRAWASRVGTRVGCTYLPASLAPRLQVRLKYQFVDGRYRGRMAVEGGTGG